MDGRRWDELFPVSQAGRHSGHAGEPRCVLKQKSWSSSRLVMTTKSALQAGVTVVVAGVPDIGLSQGRSERWIYGLVIKQPGWKFACVRHEFVYHTLLLLGKAEGL